MSKNNTGPIPIDDENIKTLQTEDKTATLGRRRVLFKINGKLTSPLNNG
jgi:hypothetical protein